MIFFKSFGPPDYSDKSNFLSPRCGPWDFFLHLHRHAILSSLRRAIPCLNGRLLDIGCGSKPYAEVLHCTEHVGVDVETARQSTSDSYIQYNGRDLPFGEHKFDSILCTEVLEHVADLDKTLSEMSRVLKPGGYAFVTVPMVFHHHEEPYDFRRLTRFGMFSLAEKMDCQVCWLDSRGGVYSVLAGSMHTTLTYTVSKRPFVDIALLFLWPFCLLLKWFDTLGSQPPPISLGWQMLVRKPI